MFTKKRLIRRVTLGMITAALVVGLSMPAPTSAASAPLLKVISPAEGATVTTTDIPVTLEVSNFTLSPLDVGMPNREGEGHIHVMHDSMSMATLFNFYATPTFTLPGEGLEPGPHTLYFDLATNDHMDLKDTMQMVHINYQPATPKPLPPPTTVSGPPSVTILSPADGATVGPKVTFQVHTTNFTPALSLEGKPNIVGYGHYHVYVNMSSGSMSMLGMVDMPGSDTFTVDLGAWPPGKYAITIEPVNNDHMTGIAGAKVGVVTINLQAAPGAVPQMGSNTNGLPLWTLLIGGLIVAILVFLVVRRG